MGTRSDFYVGKGPKAEWLGSIGNDGYPAGIPDSIKAATTERGFRREVRAFLKSRDDATVPKLGWPWPWTDSRKSDFAYNFDKAAKRVDMAYFGRGWLPATAPAPEPDDWDNLRSVRFPSMKKVQKVAFGSRSGIIVFTMR